MPTATLTTKGQVTIPKEVRDHLGVDTGVRVSFVVEEDGTVLVSPITRHVRELAGLLRRPRRRPISVRYLTRDDPAQYAKAASIIETATDGGKQCVVNTAVLCELTSVLDTVYDYSREEIAGALEQILATAQFEVERLDEARQALADFRTTKANFSDALIGRVNRTLGATHTVTFDRGLKAVETFRPI